MRIRSLFRRSVRVAKPKAELRVMYGPPDDTGFQALGGYSPTTLAANATLQACIDLLAASVSRATWKLTSAGGAEASQSLHNAVQGRAWHWRVFTHALLRTGNGFFYRQRSLRETQLIPALHGTASRTHLGELRYDLDLVDQRHMTALRPDEVVAVHMQGYDLSLIHI